ncbi:atp-dependent helicase [Methylobacterium sp. E-005]|uniref:atp-dependent helicase n=1 Tax=Methylobacterium sp. E-005 TaxID=2836549 RepID=UPI001FBAFCAD|nr:atp-dependent helicase [Methylobacterium sp. E-005]MCJ2088251.1 atp-dependent helicase [Methylobacterium sp. E-005]
MTVTGDQTLAQDLLKDLRETQAKLEGAQAEIASLKVLLALRTHQHDQAWQAAQRAAAQRDEARTTPNPVAAAHTGRRPGADGAADADAMARAEARTDAVRIVLGAVLKSLRVWGLDRRRFQSLVVQAGRETPETGPEAERHAILLVEARRVLGRGA